MMKENQVSELRPLLTLGSMDGLSSRPVPLIAEILELPLESHYRTSYVGLLNNKTGKSERFKNRTMTREDLLAFVGAEINSPMLLCQLQHNSDKGTYRFIDQSK